MNPTPTQRRSRATDADADAPTRDALAEAARRVVREHGLTGATSRRIADNAGANLASITYYFGSKDELVAEALFGQLEQLTARAFAQLEQAEVDPIARLGSAITELLATFETVRDDAPVTLHALVLAAGPSAFASHGQVLVRTLVGRLATVIGELRGAGTIATWVDPRAMASMLVATASGMALQTQLDPSGPVLQDMVSQLAGLLLAASGPTLAPR